MSEPPRHSVGTPRGSSALTLIVVVPILLTGGPASAASGPCDTPSFMVQDARPRPDAISEPRQSYRFVLKAHGVREVEFRGVISVDGRRKLLELVKTPYEFRCEAGSVITGYFEVVTPGRSLEMKVFDPSFSARHAVMEADRACRVRFAYAMPGVGPRCMDGGSLPFAACPESVPGPEAMRPSVPKQAE